MRGSGSVRIHDDGRKVADTATCDLGYDDGLRLQWASTLGNSYDGRYEVYKGSMASFKLAWTHGWMFKEAAAPTQGSDAYANRQHFHNDEGITLIADAPKPPPPGPLTHGVAPLAAHPTHGPPGLVTSPPPRPRVPCGNNAAARWWRRRHAP